MALYVIPSSPNGAPAFIIRIIPHQWFPLSIEEVARVWKATFLCSDPPPLLVPTPIWRRVKGIVCVGSGLAFPFSPCSHPLLL